MPPLDRFLLDLRGRAVKGATQALDVVVRDVYTRLTGEPADGGADDLVRALVRRDLLSPEAALHLSAAWGVLSELHARMRPARRTGLVDLQGRLRGLVDSVFTRN